MKIVLSNHKVFTRNDIKLDFSHLYLLIDYKIHVFAGLKCYSPI